ncbi:uncharacterized protein LOC112562597 isoform X3 [Pomacea canaliculata]|uniref:uncharacterized protein LOC112562597 isoform X3 n=1 Tax=Pomacea canaliculata TaxID=400727 RepID=UPI000D73E32E|nr:uncharacterized protein LOC112562597 isoform X3 [Pomacea canaliculata]
MDLTVIHYLILLLLSSIFVVPDNTAESNASPQRDVTSNPSGAINCTVIKDCCTSVDSCLQTCQSLALPSDCNCHWEDICNTMINCCPQELLTECLIGIHADGCRTFRIQVCQTSVDMICGSTTTTSTEMPEDSPSPETITTLNTSGSEPDSGPESSTSTEASTSSTPTETETTSSPTPDPTSTELTDSTTTETIWTSSGSTSSSESSASGVTSSQASAADDSAVEVAVLSCLAVLFVVVVVVAVFFWWRRKRQADDVRKENKSCLCTAINFERSQDSQENRRTNIDNASTTAANSPDNDNNDDYTYIDDHAINKGVVRLHEVTTDGQHALTDPSVSGLQPDLSSTYTLARPIDNDIRDSQPPDYFILEKDPAPDAESAQYFTLEERSEKDSAVDTDTQKYFILEDRRQGGENKFVPEVMSSESGADYFVLEKDDGQESDCVAQDDSSRCPLEDAEYSSLDPNRQESDYTALNHTA